MKITHYSIIAGSGIDELEKKVNASIKEDKMQPLGMMTCDPNTERFYQVLVRVEQPSVQGQIANSLEEINKTLETIQQTIRLNQS